MYGGRGRGRGRSTAAPPSVAANAALFSTPATSVSPNTSEPLPLFPKVALPEPKEPSTEEDLAAIRFAEELSRYMHTSPYYLTSAGSKSGIGAGEQKVDRYSDRYLIHLQASDKKGKLYAITTELDFLPEELHSVYNVERAQRAAAMAARTTTVKQVTFDETLARLKDLEGADGDGSVEKEARGEGEGDGDEAEEDEAVYEEEELEDETDYNLNYFDNGEDYGGDYDDGDGKRALYEDDMFIHP